MSTTSATSPLLLSIAIEDNDLEAVEKHLTSLEPPENINIPIEFYRGLSTIVRVALNWQIRCEADLKQFPIPSNR